MSQREGAPRTTWSAWVLGWTSWMLCMDDAPNEWQSVWQRRAALHHKAAPHGYGRYVGHRCCHGGAQPSTNHITDHMAGHAGHADHMAEHAESRSFGTNGFDS